MHRVANTTEGMQVSLAEKWLNRVQREILLSLEKE